MGKRIKIHNIDKHPTVKYEDFVELQGDFKQRSQEQIEKLSNRIIEVGFKYDFIVWESPDKTLYIVDAHGRKEALKHLENSGYTVPKVPYTRIQAKDIDEAKKEILYLNSKYGTIFENSEFLDLNFDAELDINIDLGFEKKVDEEISMDDIETSDEFSLPDGDKEPFQQITFTLADEQAEFIKSILSEVKQLDDFKQMESENENSNGNALYYIFTQWEELKK